MYQYIRVIYMSCKPPSNNRQLIKCNEVQRPKESFRWGPTIIAFAFSAELISQLDTAALCMQMCSAVFNKLGLWNVPRLNGFWR